jgi:LacI family transcriptional regulator
VRALRRAATRKDVASLAGVSPAVVSYVLNDGPRPVAGPTRERVLAAVQELNYRPDGLARSLRLGSARTIGVVVPDAVNPFFAELTNAIETAASARGYGVLVSTTANDPDRELAVVQNLVERRIDGLIFMSSEKRHGLEDLLGLDIPVVALDRLTGEAPVSTVQTRNELGALTGTNHLLWHGHLRIAFLGGPDPTVTRARRAGWREALRRAGADAEVETVAPFTFEGGWAATRELFAGGARGVTGMLVCSDVQAIGALKALDELGLRVPDDIALISFDGTTISQYTKPALTSIVQPISAFGEQAVAIIVDSPGTVQHVLLDGVLEVRLSCGCGSPHAGRDRAHNRTTPAR